MAACCLISIVMPCDEPDRLAEVAKEFLVNGLEENSPDYAKWYLESLAEGRGHNQGPKGGLVQWGMVGNHVSEQCVIDSLQPFFGLVYARRAGPLPHESVIAFFEHEASYPVVYRIEGKEHWENGAEIVRVYIEKIRCELFRWGQY